jgi:hypothetical protein
MTAPEERLRAFIATLEAEDDGIPIVEDVAEDTAVVEEGHVQRMAAESKAGPVTPPPRAKTPPPTQALTYDQALEDMRAAFVEDFSMPPQIVGLYLEAVRTRRARR